MLLCELTHIAFERERIESNRDLKCSVVPPKHRDADLSKKKAVNK
jgi:hypothetical protein